MSGGAGNRSRSDVDGGWLEGSPKKVRVIKVRASAAPRSFPNL